MLIVNLSDVRNIVVVSGVFTAEYPDRTVIGFQVIQNQQFVLIRAIRGSISLNFRISNSR